MKVRRCSKTACSQVAAATLTFVYADAQAVLGPLSLRVDPGGYDLCLGHAERLTVPKGWELIRLPGELSPAKPSKADLLELADEIRAEAFGQDIPSAPLRFEVSRRKGHLAVLADVD